MVYSVRLSKAAFQGDLPEVLGQNAGFRPNVRKPFSSKKATLKTVPMIPNKITEYKCTPALHCL